MTKADLQQLWRGLCDSFEEWNLRERILMTLCAAALITGIFDSLLTQPLQREQAALALETETSRLELKALNAETRMLASEFTIAPNAGLIDDETNLVRQLELLDERLRHQMGSLIPPDEMPEVLERLLAEDQTLEFIRLESGAARPLKTYQEGGATSKRETDPNAAQVFEHEVVMELEGDYMAALRYLESIEDLPWQFVWRRLDYRVLEHPRARIILRIHTLSSQEAWIGV